MTDINVQPPETVGIGNSILALGYPADIFLTATGRWYCCCGGGGSCECGDGTPPTFLSVTFGSIANGDFTIVLWTGCIYCTDLNMTHVLSHESDPDPCTWALTAYPYGILCIPVVSPQYAWWKITASATTLASGNCGWRVKLDIVYPWYQSKNVIYEWDSGGVGPFDMLAQRTLTVVSSSPSDPSGNICLNLASSTCQVN